MSKLPIQPAKEKLPAQKKAEVTKLAKALVAEVDKTDLIEKVASKLDITNAQALTYIEENGLEDELHTLMVKSITSGAIAIKALEKLHRLAEEGDKDALSMIVGFNKELMPNTAKSINSLHLHNDQSVTNVFAEMNDQAKKLLGEQE